MGSQNSQCMSVEQQQQYSVSIEGLRVGKNQQFGNADTQNGVKKNSGIFNFRDRAFESLKFVNIFAPKYERAINQLSKYFDSKKVIRSKYFQGKLDDNHNPIGNGLYCRVEGNYYNIYLGIIESGKPAGAGLRVKIYRDQNEQHKRYNEEILWIDDWSKQQNLEGCFINRREKEQTVYVGTFFGNMQMKEGKLMVIAQEAVVKQYTGKFKNNQFHDREGELIMTGKYEYKGEFSKNNKHGFGVERDFIKKATYIGEFADNQKEGFGEIIYDGEKKIKLRGFWSDGRMSNQLGVFVDAKGQTIEVYSTQ